MIKKITLNIILLLILVLGTIEIIVLTHKVNYSPNNFLGSLMDKNKYLEDTDSPRIIFLGGSNVAFGIDCGAIETEFKIPVINMGMHGGLGLGFILNDMKHYIKNGDIIILSTEYYLDKFGYSHLKYLTQIYPESKQFIDYDMDYYKQISKYKIDQVQIRSKEFLDFIFADVIGLKQKSVSEKNEEKTVDDTLVYSRKLFNQHGDIETPFANKPQAYLQGSAKMEAKEYDKSIDKLNEFAEYVRSKGGKVFYIYPSYPENEYNLNHDVITNFESQFKEKLNIELLSRPEDSVFPDSLFFDTVYHLNADGRKQRTGKIIKLMKEKVIGKN